MAEEDKTSTRELALNLLLMHGESNASELAGLVGISVQAMRRQLRKMELEGLVKPKLRVNGSGRPSNDWELTFQGQKHFHDGSERFALDLMGSIKTALSEESIKGLFESQVTTKVKKYREEIGVGAIEERLAKLVELRRLEGFLPECIPDEEGKGWYINEFHCSVRTIAEDHPCLCDQELDIFRKTLPDCDVERVQWMIKAGHFCGFHITRK